MNGGVDATVKRVAAERVVGDFIGGVDGAGRERGNG